MTADAEERFAASRRPSPLRTVWIVLGAMLASTLVISWIDSGSQTEPSDTPGPRPNTFLIDQAGLLTDMDESTNRYLLDLWRRHGIDVRIVTLPALPAAENIKQTAARLMDQLQIGRHAGGRGVLVLMSKTEQEVKLEVSYQLEDVFTDAFCGFISDLQLKPYFKLGGVEIGLIAVMEELQRRAIIKSSGKYSTETIIQMDRDYLSGGAGIKRQLEQYGARYELAEGLGLAQGGSSVYTDSYHLALFQPRDPRFPAGRTVEEAWHTLLASSRALAAEGDGYARRTVQDFYGRAYKISSNENYAIVHFDPIPGKDGFGHLFAKTSQGWKFDIVNSRRFVRQGPDRFTWGIERADHDYIDLAAAFPWWMGIDYPREDGDWYHVAEDSRIVAKILELEKEYKRNPENFEVALELGRLGVLTQRRPWYVYPALRQAKRLNPGNPLPYRYLAIENLENAFQYEKAQKELETYIRLKPEDPWGYSMLGYIHHQRGEYPAAIRAWRKVLERNPEDCYAVSRLAYAFQDYYRAKQDWFSRIVRYPSRRQALNSLQSARAACGPTHRRIAWLEYYLNS